MIEFRKGNIVKADAEALVNTVNTVGIMGKGIALAFKKAFPENYNRYKIACDNKEFTIGEILITETGRITPKYIINFPTKVHWKEKSKLAYIEKGMKKLVQVIHDYEIQSIAIPPLGCGNGGLNWQDVKKVMLGELERLQENIDIIIFEPGYNDQTTETQKTNNLTPARAMLLTALKDYQVLGYSINLLVAQKLAYFMQRLGEPLRLEYEKGYYGPYSHRLQHLLKYLNGSFLQFRNEQTKPGTKVKLNYTEQAIHYTQNQLSTEQQNRLEELKQLTEGFESPYGLELLATVDFIYQKTGMIDKDKVSQEIGKWTHRKRELMKPYHIEVAINRLMEFYQRKQLTHTA